MAQSMKADPFDAIFQAAIKSPLYSYQREIVLGRERLRIINKARRTGVTTALAYRAFLGALAGRTEIIVSPSERQSTLVMVDYIEKFLRALPAHLKPRLVEDAKSVKRFEGGGAIYSLPNSPPTIRGFSPDDIYLDEAAHFLNGTDEAIFESIFPMLGLGGGMMVSSTPFGDSNLFCRLWREGKDWTRIVIRWQDCPPLAQNIDAVRKEFDEASFAQEFGNEFRGETASEFPLGLLSSCVDPELEYEVNAQADSAGWDVARRVDLSVICLVRKEGEKRRLVEKHVWRGVPFAEQKERALPIAQRVAVFRIDQGGMGEEPAEWLAARAPSVKPLLFTNENKTAMFLNLKKLFEQKGIIIPMDPRLMRSLNSVKRYYSQGRVILDAERTDETGHADEATALALACYEPPPRAEAAFVEGDF